MAVQIAGIYMERSLNAFQRACEGYIEAEHEKLAPDNVLIALLCDAVRLTRELTLAMTGISNTERTNAKYGD